MRRLFTLSLLAVMPLAQANVRAFLTFPDVHGAKAIFTAEGDLWLADTESGTSRRLTTDPGLETRAHFSPDGSQIAFNANYDGGAEIYVMPIEGGIPKRLTFDPTGAELLGWTPDGQELLFRSHSKQVTTYVGQFAEYEVFSVPVAGGVPKKVKVPTANFATLSPDGQLLAFVPTSSEWMNWFRYEAGEADQIWLADLKKGGFERVTNTNGIETQPVWADGSLFFVSERTGVRNLYRMEPKTKKVKQITFSTTEPVRNPSTDGKSVVYEIGPKIGIYDPQKGSARTVDFTLSSDRIHARPFAFPVASFSQVDVSPTGKRAVLAVRGRLVTVPVGEGVAHNVAGGGVQRIQNPAWSPDGKLIAYTSDASGEEELYVAEPVEGAKPRQVTKGLGGQLYSPVWSPDSKYIVLGDRANQILVVEVATGSCKRVAKTENGTSYDTPNSDYVFSPDSKWIAFQQPQPPGIPQVALYEIATEKTTVVSNPTIPSGSPAFSPDGKWLYMIQNREINPAVDGVSNMLFADNSTRVTALALAADVKSPYLDKNEEESDAAKPEPPADGKHMQIELAGLSDRAIDMKVPAGRYTKVLAIGGRLILLNASTPQLIEGSPSLDLIAFDIASKTPSTLAEGVTGASLSADGKKLLVTAPGAARVVDAGGGPVGPTQGLIRTTAKVWITPEDEWKQIFEESWRVARDFFYDPNMHGVDWKAMRAKYEAQLPLIASRSDLLRIQKDLLSELNTGHCYVGAPGEFTRRGSQVGLLGATLVWDAAAGAYQLGHIYRGDDWDPSLRSPLAAQGISLKDGVYLLQIDGVDLQKDQDPSQLLVGKVGTKVSVTVNSKPTLVGAQTYTVTTLASDADLRHLDWLVSKRKYVEKASGGKIAYVYLSDMTDKGARDFAHDYYGAVEKPGIIFDVRGNGGGFTADQFFAQIACRPTGMFSTRYGTGIRIQTWMPLGHLAAVTDQWAFSDGEWFSEFWKRLKLGPLVGHRTGGGCVGSGGGYALVDGGQIYIPNYGAYASGTWVIEGRGTVPDVEVDQDPASLMAGKDPQLDKTIELLQAAIAKDPVEKPVHPPFPVKTKGSRDGYGKG